MPELVSVMRRDIRSDRTVRDDVRAATALFKQAQPEAIKLVMEQMESMAPRFAEARA